jgi:transposase
MLPDEYRARPDDDDLVPAGEAAEMMSVPIKSLYNWISAYNTTGVLHGPPFVRVGRRVKYRKGDIRRYLHDHTFGTHA